MTTTTLNQSLPGEQILSSLRRFGSSVRNAIDTYAEYRMRNAVPHWEARRSDREISRYRNILGGA